MPPAEPLVIQDPLRPINNVGYVLSLHPPNPSSQHLISTALTSSTFLSPTHLPTYPIQTGLFWV